MNELLESPALVVGSRLASRVAPNAERGPLPYLVFSGVLDAQRSESFRRRVEETQGDGYEGYVAQRRAMGVIAEVMYLIHAPHGDVALLVLHAPGAVGVYDALGGAVRPFHEWFEGRALAYFGLPKGQSGPAGQAEETEVLFRWRM